MVRSPDKSKPDQVFEFINKRISVFGSEDKTRYINYIPLQFVCHGIYFTSIA